MSNSHPRALRGEVGGWSAGATRRNTQFLQSVREDQLDGTGYAVTLTLRDCPTNSDAWHRLLKAWTMRMQRAGMLRLHAVTEWQRRGVPHFHGAIWFPDPMVAVYGHANMCSLLINAWMELTMTAYGSGWRSQQAHLITGAVGWFKYVSKHAARGVRHYQRSPENVPEGWQKRTGRMWSKWGDWPVGEPLRLNLQSETGDGGWFAYRRIVRSWRVADARASGDASRIRYARAMLTCHERALSRVRGLSEWIPQDVMLTMVSNLSDRGFQVYQQHGRQPSPKGVDALEMTAPELVD